MYLEPQAQSQKLGALEVLTIPHWQKAWDLQPGKQFSNQGTLHPLQLAALLSVGADWLRASQSQAGVHDSDRA